MIVQSEKMKMENSLLGIATKFISMIGLDYYDKDGYHKEIHGFKTPKEAEYYMQKHPEKFLVNIH